MRRGAIALTCAAVLATCAAGALVLRRHPAEAPKHAATAPAPPPEPTLYCEFYNFMRSATVASFYFTVDLHDGDPKYFERYMVDNEGQKTDFGGDDQSPIPQWIYRIEDDTPTITAPDSETKIVLYGLKPKTGGVFWIEAGVRSDSYRNLEGKCRQAYYGPPAAAKN